MILPGKRAASPNADEDEGLADVDWMQMVAGLRFERHLHGADDHVFRITVVPQDIGAAEDFIPWFGAGDAGADPCGRGTSSQLRTSGSP